MRNGTLTQIDSNYEMDKTSDEEISGPMHSPPHNQITITGGSKPNHKGWTNHCRQANLGDENEKRAQKMPEMPTHRNQPPSSRM